MLNKGKILWYIQVGIPVLLLLMSSTDLIIKEKKIEVYPISVIVEGDSDDYYVNFRKGMDQAAVGSHGDISFIILYADHGQAQQMELAKREIRDGARAVVLAPVKSEEVVRKLENMNPGCSVISLGQSPDEGTVLGTVGMDGRETGRLLGEVAVPQVSRDMPVYLSCGRLDYGDSVRAYEGVRTALDEWGYHYRLIGGRNQDIYCQTVQETDAPKGGRVTITALDVQSLDQVARILEENIIYQGRVAGSYDAGSTTSLSRAPDKGIVIGLIAYDQFDEGYSGVKQAVEVIQGTCQKRNTVLEVICVDKDKLRDRAHERMLYPTE